MEESVANFSGAQEQLLPMIKLPLNHSSDLRTTKSAAPPASNSKFKMLKPPDMKPARSIAVAVSQEIFPYLSFTVYMYVIFFCTMTRHILTTTLPCINIHTNLLRMSIV